jgi:hypothetical protein
MSIQGTPIFIVTQSCMSIQGTPIFIVTQSCMSIQGTPIFIVTQSCMSIQGTPIFIVTQSCMSIQGTPIFIVTQSCMSIQGTPIFIVTQSCMSIQGTPIAAALDKLELLERLSACTHACAGLTSLSTAHHAIVFCASGCGIKDTAWFGLNLVVLYEGPRAGCARRQHFAHRN